MPFSLPSPSSLTKFPITALSKIFPLEVAFVKRCVSDVVFTGDVWTVDQTEEKLSVFMCPERELRFLLYSYQPLYSS